MDCGISICETITVKSPFQTLLWLICCSIVTFVLESNHLYILYYVQVKKRVILGIYWEKYLRWINEHFNWRWIIAEIKTAWERGREGIGSEVPVEEGSNIQQKKKNWRRWERGRWADGTGLVSQGCFTSCTAAWSVIGGHSRAGGSYIRMCIWKENIFEWSWVCGIRERGRWHLIRFSSYFLVR